MSRMQFEYKLLEAGNWQFERLHDVLAQEQRQGWQLDSVYGGEPGAGEPLLQVWLRRPAEVRRAS
jgi:hypothetical protein